MVRLLWDFACVFDCFGSGILFISLEKVLILVLEGIRFLSLLILYFFIRRTTVFFVLVSNLIGLTVRIW